jgi:hypothetical protein
MRRIRRDHSADDEPIEQHADRGEVLLDGRLFEFFSQPADIGRDVHRLDVGQLLDILAPIAPGEEAPAGVKVRVTRVLVVDCDAEKFEEASHGLFAAGSPPAATIAGTTIELPPAVFHSSAATQSDDDQPAVARGA